MVSARDQLERASTSIALNFAEGNAKLSVKDRLRFWQIAQGSAFECAACLDVFVARQILSKEEVLEGKDQIERRKLANRICYLERTYTGK